MGWAYTNSGGDEIIRDGEATPRLLTAGDRTVILVRCDSLSDAVRHILARPPAERAMFLWDAEWHAQRLQSSVERALGTRGRHYDGARP